MNISQGKVGTDKKKLPLAGSASDVDACLCAGELDLLLGDVLMFRAAALHDVLHGKCDISSIKYTMDRSDKQLAILWIRHHWVATRITATTIEVFDSAASEAVAKDITKVAIRTGRVALFRTCPQQMRGSNECGIFAASYVLVMNAGLEVPRNGDKVSLKGMRALWPRTSSDLENCTVLMLKMAIELLGVQGSITLQGDGKPGVADAVGCRRWRHNPYSGGVVPAHVEKDTVKRVPSTPSIPKKGTKASWEALGDQLRAKANLPLLGAVTQTSASCKAGARLPIPVVPVVVDVDAETPESQAQAFLEDIYRAEGLLGELHRESEKGTSICTENMDLLFALVVVGLPVRTASCLSQRRYTEAGEYLQPVWHNGHFVLLATTCQVSGYVAKVYDSLPRHVPQERDQIIARILPPPTSQSSLQVVNVGPQGQNECAFKTLESVGRHCKVHVPWRREDVMPRLVERRRRELLEARERLQKFLDSPRPDVILRCVSPLTQPLSEQNLPLTRPDVTLRCVSPLTQPLSEQDLPLRWEAVRKFVKEAALGNFVLASWRHHDEDGTWIGIVRRKWTPGLPLVCEYSFSKCGTCGEYTSMDSIEMKLPFPSTVYFRLEIISPPTVVCTCEDEDLLVDEVPETQTVPLGHLASQMDELVVESCGEQVEVTSLSPHTVLFPQELQGAFVPYAPSTGMTLGACGSWYVYAHRPPHIQLVAWNRLADSTRKAHIRMLNILKGAPPELKRVSIGAGAVELLLRMARIRRWKWSTISKSFSEVRASIQSLSMYTNIAGFDIAQDATFLNAMRRVQHLARIDCKPECNTSSLPRAIFDKILSQCKEAAISALLQMMWLCASRPKDTASVRREDVKIEKLDDHNDRMSVTFRFGKGAAFCGPYTVVVIVPRSLSKLWQGLTSSASTPFTAQHQRRLALLLKVEGYSLRSVRKGMINLLAQREVSDDTIRLLSGHARADTLRRYLGWGINSATAKNAAMERHKALVRGGGASPVGPHSGTIGKKGQRFSVPDTGLYPLRPPTSADLGLSVKTEKEYPLHLKQPTLIDWGAVKLMARGTRLETRIALAFALMSDETLFSRHCLEKQEARTAAFTAEQINALHKAEKIAPTRSEDVVAWVNGFVIVEEEKKRLRPIFEPLLNAAISSEDLPPVHYLSRYERRARWLNQEMLCGLFDFSGFFDAFELPIQLRKYFGFRDRSGKFWTLTRLPMGAAWAPFVAQQVTWLLLDGMEAISETCIDNVRILMDATRADEFLKTLSIFLERCSKCNLLLNDVALWTDPSQWMTQCRIWGKEHTFLGETFLKGGRVCNTVKLVKKLQRVQDNWRDSKDQTFRRFAAYFGLIFYMMNTLDIRMCDHYSLIRGHSAVLSAVTHWDDVVPYLSPSLLGSIEFITASLLLNHPTQAPVIRRPSSSADDYEATVIVDASQHGLGAFVRLGNRVYRMRHRWPTILPHSSMAEPLAATWVIDHLRCKKLLSMSGDIAIVTDHSAMVLGQRRWRTGTGGYGWGQALNDMFRATPTAQFFFVQGTMNPADGPSRTTELGDECLEVEFSFPQLSNFEHPYLREDQKEDFMR